MTIDERLKRIERLLILNGKEVFDVADLSTYLGVSESRIYHLVSDRGIPHYKQGKQVRFSKREIDDWMLGERIPTNAELQTQCQQQNR